jgi:hypothetical protein
MEQTSEITSLLGTSMPCSSQETMIRQSRCRTLKTIVRIYTLSGMGCGDLLDSGQLRGKAMAVLRVTWLHCQRVAPHWVRANVGNEERRDDNFRPQIHAAVQIIVRSDDIVPWSWKMKSWAQISGFFGKLSLRIDDITCSNSYLWLISTIRFVVFAK